ncbi:ABC transporter substrate-binding protein [Streptomyces kaniharaensis]|uniref:ABC transporter substrate-binding protein n=1 Tax=Streptomyces kaniharaensis TaxID=212423 RepID=A0A6N7KU84_9ACTN|nr:ABC transporter substrate-binding protein [Streptomyces kaniharaensis]MQS15001.1 ABC transporter substrate-binding protein [Streptomyces kaniharaensis]
MRPRVVRAIAAAVALFATATACGSSGGGDGRGAQDAAKAAPAGGFPVKVADCAGRETTIAKAPARIVTSNAAALEMLLQLGTGDRLIGTGFPPGKGTLPADLAERGGKVPVLGDRTVPKEKLLGSGADLYVDTFSAMPMMGGGATGPTEEEFTAAGIQHVFLLSTACAGTPKAAKAPRTDLAEVENDIRRLGAVTGTAARAEELVTGMEQRIGEVRAALAAVPDGQRPSYFVFDFDAGTKQPTAVCGRQVANAVITLAGARNVFADCDADFKPGSWEDVIAKNPDWIQLAVRNRGTEEATRKAFDDAEAFLRSFPATQGLKAVQEGHFVRIGSEVTTIAGVRNADAVRQIAATVHPDLVKGGQ